jgi:hypothetical protein
MQNSGAALLAAIVTAIVVFSFTNKWFMAKAARNTVRTAKAAVPAARTVFWKSVGGVVKLALLVGLLVLVLVAWATRDLQGADEQKPAPTPSATHR